MLMYTSRSVFVIVSVCLYIVCIHGYFSMCVRMCMCGVLVYGHVSFCVMLVCNYVSVY